MARIDITNKRFNRLTAIKYVGKDTHNHSVWECLCDCGKTAFVPVGCLSTGKTKSCGCLKLERSSFLNRTHGKSRSPEYRNWCAMKERCNREAHKNYGDYGGRGIRVCDRWESSFENFLTDMGTRPTPRSTVERIDSDKGYSPENCRWAEMDEQQRNKRNTVRIVFNGERKSIGEWAQLLGVTVNFITKRLYRGWSPHDALSVPKLR
jgi:hypothetical protein